MQKIIQSVMDHLPYWRRPVAFEPVQSDGDELTRAIYDDIHVHDNDWQLHEPVDPTRLEAFWDEVLHELGPDKTNDN